MSDYAKHRLEHGEKYPYHELPPADWAERAALGVLADLGDRRGIKHELNEPDLDVKAEIVATLADIIRCAHSASTDEQR